MSSPSAETRLALGRTFFLAGPTAVGKSSLAAALAARCGGEVIGADAFQIYQGMPLLTAKPARGILQMAPHHLIDLVPVGEAFNAARYAELAMQCIAGVIARGRLPIVAGGTGLYIRALTHGLSDLPEGDPGLRRELEKQPLAELGERLRSLDPDGAALIDLQNPRRVIRALEVCILSGKPFSLQRDKTAPLVDCIHGVYLTRPRQELYARINRRVEEMFERGVVDEVQQLGDAGPTASRVLGLNQIKDYLNGNITRAACMEQIQRATRGYAKRQLTWFSRKSNFEPFNLSIYEDHDLLLKELLQKVRPAFAALDV